jgi:hypothetical protein
MVQKQYRRADAEVVKMQERKISDLERRPSRLEKLVGSQAWTLAQSGQQPRPTQLRSR